MRHRLARSSCGVLPARAGWLGSLSDSAFAISVRRVTRDALRGADTAITPVVGGDALGTTMGISPAAATFTRYFDDAKPRRCAPFKLVSTSRKASVDFPDSQRTRCPSGKWAITLADGFARSMLGSRRSRSCEAS